MALEKSRIVEQGESPHAHEREAVEFTTQQLPNTDPYHLWALCDLIDPPTGRLYEIDLIVLGYSALYIVEVKSGPGRYIGDSVDWHRLPPDGSKPRYMDPPLRLTNHKAKVLKSRLDKKMQGRAPWTEALVFLSAPEADLQIDLRDDGRVRVVTRSGLRDALTKHQFFGADANRKPSRISAPEMRDIVQAMSAIGLQRRKGKAFAGQYELKEVLLEGSGFQDRAAEHRTLEGMRRRARVYLVPQQTSVERRQQLRRAAEREAQLLYGLREHPNILSFIDHETDAPLGPTVLFDEFEGGIPLPAFLRQEAGLTFEERATIVCQVGRALHFCHQNGVVHRALSPDAVLVRRHPDDRRIDTRLFNFQLAEGDRASATVHWSQLASDPWALYQAPELREDSSRGSEVTDIFSLGAVAYFVLTGKDPGASLREVEERLMRDGFLDPSAVVDYLPESVAELVRAATTRTPARRFDHLFSWVEILAAEAKPLAPIAPPEVSPLDATEKDIIGGDLMVEKVLGHGATSRVLQVVREKDNSAYALKVSLSEVQDERLREEGEALAKLRHPRINELVERRTIGGRQCLLLSLAGKETLQSYLVREGTVSLDYAARFGEDLLSALEYLQEEGVVHRDIKPANVGIGAPTKKDIRLTLFDFSLVRAAPSDLHVGTSAYRDPFLSVRGQWDTAADRYSAAVTLHEMLTGVRPRLADGKSHLDPDAEVIIAAERFDPSCRDALSAFFERAVARDLDRRWGDAKQMRQAWERAFRTESAHPTPATAIDGTSATRRGQHQETAPAQPPSSEPRAVRPSWSEEVLRAIGPSTTIEGLPLSTRARNALDRAGAAVARDVLSLPDNRLSVVRGVGSLVVEEILAFRAAWTAVSPMETPVVVPFFVGYRGEDLLITTLGIEGSAATVLHDAGLRTLRAIAGAPDTTITQLAERHAFDAAAVHSLLAKENSAAAARAHPTTVEGWVDVLVSPAKKRAKYLLSLFGLVEPFLGRLDVSANDVATHLDVTRANVYFALGDCRPHWEKHASIADLRAMVHGVIDEAAGALPLAKAASGLLAHVAHDRTVAPAVSLARAAALVRVVTEVEKDAPNGLSFVRIHDRPWIVASEGHAAGLRDLGAACDTLADRSVLASWGEVSRVLVEAAAGSPFAMFGADVLARLGTDVSSHAACSARQEIYRKGLPATRALELCAPLLRGRLTAEAIAARVAARYPEAEALPARPELDALLEPHHLTFDGQVFHRLGDRPAATSVLTSFSSLPKEVDEHAADFDDRLRNAVERGGLRVVGVRAVRAEAATMALAKRLGVVPIDISAKLIEQMRVLAAEGEVDEGAVHKADVDADGAPETWALLRKLANDAAERLADTLLPPKAPLVLAQPGLLARYRLDAFSERLRAAADEEHASPIFVVVPSRDVGRIPRLADWSIAGAKSMWMPETWVQAASKS